MFRQMNRISLTAAAASVLFLSPGLAGAGAQSAAPAPKPALAPKPAAALDQSLYFDLDFPGGTLEQYIKAIRTAHGSANVMLSDEAKTVRIPATKLNGVTLDAAVNLLGGQVLTRDDQSYTISAQKVNLDRRREHAYSINVYPFETAADRLKKKRGDSKTDQADAGARSNVWSLRDLIDGGMKMDDVLGAITAAVETIDQPYKVKLHKPTTLLIVRGTDEQLTLVDQVVSAMQRDANNAAASKFGLSDRIEAMQSAIIKAETKSRVAEKELEIALEYAKLNRQSLEKEPERIGAKGADSVDPTQTRLDLAVVKAQGELQIAQDKAEKLRKRLDRLRSEYAKPSEHD